MPARTHRSLTCAAVLIFVVLVPLSALADPPRITTVRCQQLGARVHAGDPFTITMKAQHERGVSRLHIQFCASQYVGGNNEMMLAGVELLPTGNPDEFGATVTIPEFQSGTKDKPLPSGRYRISQTSSHDREGNPISQRYQTLTEMRFDASPAPAWELFTDVPDPPVPGKPCRVNVRIGSRLTERTSYPIELAISDYHRTWQSKATSTLEADSKERVQTTVELPTEDFGLYRIEVVVGDDDTTGVKQHTLWANAKPRSHMLAGPYLIRVSQTQATVMWETVETSRGVVQFGPTEKLTRTAEEDEAVTTHKVLIDGLQPGTLYRYRLADGSSPGPVCAFLTTPRSDQPFRIGLAADTQSAHPEGRRPWNRGAELLMDHEVKAVVILGDLVEHCDRVEQWRAFFRRARGLFAHVPVYPVVGNHEIWPDNGNSHFFRYFDFPDRKAVYHFDYGNAHIVVLDSTWIGLQSGWFDTKWVGKILQESNAEWQFVFFHYPPYSPKPYPEYDYQGGQAMLDVMAKHGVDMVASGHQHSYERSYPMAGGKPDHAKGVVYVSLGGSGGGKASTRQYPWALRVGPGNDIAVIDIEGKTLQYRRVRDDGQVKDAATFTHDPAYLQAIVAELGSASGNQSIEPLNRLARLRGMRFGPELQTAAQPAVRLVADLGTASDDSAVRIAAAAALAALAPIDAEAVASAARALARDADVQVREAAVEALSETGQADDLVPFLDSETATVRRAALWGLIRCASPATKDLLWQIVLTDKDDVARHLAVRALDRLDEHVAATEFRRVIDLKQEHSRYVQRVLEQAASRREAGSSTD